VHQVVDVLGRVHQVVDVLGRVHQVVDVLGRVRQVVDVGPLWPILSILTITPLTVAIAASTLGVYYTL
jgi:hypothetical protein